MKQIHHHSTEPRQTRLRLYTALLLLIAAAVLIGVGLARGEARTVLGKAAVICLQCIGLD